MTHREVSTPPVVYKGRLKARRANTSCGDSAMIILESTVDGTGVDSSWPEAGDTGQYLMACGDNGALAGLLRFINSTVLPPTGWGPELGIRRAEWKRRGNLRGIMQIRVMGYYPHPPQEWANLAPSRPTEVFLFANLRFHHPPSPPGQPTFVHLCYVGIALKHHYLAALVQCATL